jgi:uncharacterized membrane protein
MKPKEKLNRVAELLKSYKHFDKILKYLLLIGIITLSGFLIYFLLTPEPGYVSYGILNSEKEAGNYPVTVKAGDNVSFYLTVANYLNRQFSFRIEIRKGNSTVISHTSNPLNTQSVLNTSIIILGNHKSWISDLFNISFTQPGVNQTIITELWEIKNGLPGKFFTSLYLRLNVTL